MFLERICPVRLNATQVFLCLGPSLPNEVCVCIKSALSHCCFPCLNKLNIRPSFPAVFNKLLAVLDPSNVGHHSQCGVEGFSEPCIVFVDDVVDDFPTSLLNVVKDVNDVDIV